MKRIISLIAAVLALVSAGFGAYVWHWEHRPHVLEIYCFALDKSGNSPGNLAVFIRTPDGHTALIDGGKSASVISALSSVMPFYRRSIDTLISTDPDDSHATGLADVVGRYRIGRVVEPNAPGSDFFATSSAHDAFEAAISEQKIRHDEVSAGDEISLGDSDISVTVLFPPSAAASGTSVQGFAFSKTNLPVLAFSIRYGSTTILFAGEISKKEQAYVAAEASGSSPFSNQFSAQSYILPHILLILPHGENEGVADRDFFTALNPENIQNVVVLKKPLLTRPPTEKTDPTAPASTTAKAKIKKPAKIPFSIADIAGLSIVNLATEGDAEFISDGVIFTRKKIK